MRGPPFALALCTTSRSARRHPPWADYRERGFIDNRALPPPRQRAALRSAQQTRSPDTSTSAAGRRPGRARGRPDAAILPLAPGHQRQLAVPGRPRLGLHSARHRDLHAQSSCAGRPRRFGDWQAYAELHRHPPAPHSIERVHPGWWSVRTQRSLGTPSSANLRCTDHGRGGEALAADHRGVYGEAARDEEEGLPSVGRARDGSSRRTCGARFRWGLGRQAARPRADRGVSGAERE